VKRCTFVLVLSILIAAAHRLPAPIQEVQESPPPALEQAARPKKPTKPKLRPEAGESVANLIRQHPSSKHSPFAGTWTGTMQTFPAGNQTTVLTVDPIATTMTVTWFGKTGSANAQLDGGTLRATFPPPAFQPQPHKWSLTPQPDGVTARVHFECFMNDYTSVFQKRSSSTVTMASPATPPAAPVARSGQTGPPTAKPVPDKPGFVYDPFDPNSKMLLDVRGRAPGTKVKDPSGRLFVVP
jgi:hypothetical protein